MHEPLLKASYTTDRLLVEEPVLALRRVGDLERFLLAEPSSKFMAMTILGVQNLPWNSGEITHCFGSLGCWVTMCEWTSIASSSRASFQS